MPTPLSEPKKRGRRPHKPGTVFGPYAVVGVTDESVYGKCRVYVVRCRCGREHRKPSAALGGAKIRNAAGCRYCTGPSRKLGTPTADRDARMTWMYRHNVTDIDQLARIYGITRKRVRQIVTKPETADASK